MEKQEIKGLKRRYLIWFYKSVKEDLDKIERKFTQVETDKLILKELKKADKKGELVEHVGKFENYVQSKERTGMEQKFVLNKVRPEYRFLELKLAAVEQAIIKELGKTELPKIRAMYEEEMTRRILRSTEH